MCYIVSDSNSEFIKWILKKQELTAMFKKIYTNNAFFDGQGRLIIQPYQSHTCPDCPLNICKQTIVREILEQENGYDKFYYLGDGVNDFCPLKINYRSKSATAYVRKAYGLENKIKKMSAEAVKNLNVQIVYWNTGLEVLEHMKKDLEQTD